MNQCTLVCTVIRGIRLSVAAALLALLAGLLVLTQPARALSYEVTNSNNSGPGSLRQAIDDANSNPGPDIITFAAATDGNPIILAGVAGEDVNAGGDLDILEGGDLTIQGNGAANTIIDGGGIDRVFDVCPGGGCANTVTFVGVTIRNSAAVFGGGGIYNWSGTTTVDGSTVSANTAMWGAGIYNDATLIVQNGSTIGGAGAGNSALLGGGIYNNSGATTTVDGSTVSDNTADLSGGGIENSGILTVQNGSTVSANRAEDNGGGIYNVFGTTTVDGSTVSDNTANQYGGGIFNEEDATTMVDGSTFSGNSADYGGGILNIGTLNVENDSTVSTNTARFGGGIFNWATLTVDGSTISANAANIAGGGIFNQSGTTTVDGSTVSANMSGDLGGGILNLAGTTTVTESRVLSNTATTDGGGVYNLSNIAGATSVTGGCIVGNSATSYFNNQPALQIATGNWWGAVTGPNTPGADTVGGNVDVSGYLTAPILGCGPDLQVDKANDTDGNGIEDTPFHWTLTVSNSGIFDATFEAEQTILVDELPAGPTYGAPVAGNFVGVANSDNIQCSLDANTLTCGAAGGDVTLAALSGSFEVTFSVTPNAAGTLTNPSGVCQVDPDGHVTENDESNNDCPANTVNVEVSTKYLYLPVVLKP